MFGAMAEFKIYSWDEKLCLQELLLLLVKSQP
ncbi:MAG: hypothetical protein ACI8YN_000589 [Porticoccaceae bacterium]|jgi:hypothetical protein